MVSLDFYRLPRITKIPSAKHLLSALGAALIPTWMYIRTPSADINKLGESFKKMEGIEQL